jgi:hypothetical protein
MRRQPEAGAVVRTHFFQDLVEQDIFYVPVFPRQKAFAFDRPCLRTCRTASQI